MHSFFRSGRFLEILQLRGFSIKAIAPIILFVLFGVSCSNHKDITGTTEITRWQDGKKGAVSITLDDGSINQFRQALPIMNRLNFKGTFFIITGDIPGSEYKAKFIGRPINEIMKETAIMPTNDANIFERGSALPLLDIENAVNYHAQAGSLYEQGDTVGAYQLIDEGFAKAREMKAGLKPYTAPSTKDAITWQEMERFAKQGHEFANHTVSHPRLAILDEKNMRYELEKGKEEILNHLGPEHTFSAECPFGTEDERVMAYAHKVHPALRNRMPEPFLEELDRWNERPPGSSSREYVQWQRGPLAATSMETMKSWVDTLTFNKNIWLVLVFHGIDGVGWEAKPHEQFEEFLGYIKKHEDKIWVATFGDVTRYMRERMSASVNSKMEAGKILVRLDHTLDAKMYKLPLTLKTYVDKAWKNVTVKQGQQIRQVEAEADAKSMYVMYQAAPNAEPVEIYESN
jgi:peptidoglycan/xylan/chitin deacetylase (PgdA/CDA1 family)